MDWYDNMNIIPWINMGRKFSCQWGGWSYPCNLFKPSLMKNQTHTHTKRLYLNEHLYAKITDTLIDIIN